MELENQILGVEREGDLPGEMIPYYYFEYLRTQQAFQLVPIFHHNVMDIVSLACLTAIVPFAFRSPEETALRHGADLIGLARWLAQAERHEKPCASSAAPSIWACPTICSSRRCGRSAAGEEAGAIRRGAGGLHGSGGGPKSVSRAGARRAGQVLRAPRAELRDGARDDAQRAGASKTPSRCCAAARAAA